MVEEKDIGWYNPNYIVGYGKLGGVEVRTPGRKNFIAVVLTRIFGVLKSKRNFHTGKRILLNLKTFTI